MILSKRNNYNQLYDRINNIPLKDIQYYLRFKKMCGNKGVQGYVGIMSVRESKELPSLKSVDNYYNNIVFKFSREIDFATEHEAMMLYEMNKLNCPHFVGYYRLFSGKIDKSFYNKKTILFSDNDYIPHNILLMEYVETNSKFNTLDTIVRGDSDKIERYNIEKMYNFKQHLIVSQLLQTLITLEIGQIYKDFTHYDIHSDNILEVNCEYNSVMIYKYTDNNTIKYQIVPTYGFYVKLIDLGMSYCISSNNKPIYSTMGNYENGAQSGVFDPLNDVHHLIISTFYDIEEYGNKTHISLANNIRTTFSHVPILIKKGWKQLPNDILMSLTNKIIRTSNIFNDIIIDEYKITDMLCHLVILPFQKYSDYEDFEYYNKDGIEYLISEINKNIKDEMNIDAFLLCMKDLIEAQNCVIIENDNKKTFKEEYSETYSYKEGLVDFDYIKISKSMDIIHKQFSSYIYNKITNHLDIIKDGYNIIRERFKSPIDMFHFLYQNLTPHFQINSQTLVYVYDADKCQTTCNNIDKIDSELLKKINISNRYDKAKSLYEYIHNTS
jgi:hypothetical protein